MRCEVVAHGERLVTFPLRVVLALVVIGAVTAIGVWGLVTVLRIKSMTEAQRMMTVAGIVTLVSALTAWVIFLWARVLGLARAHSPFASRGSTVSGQH